MELSFLEKYSQDKLCDMIMKDIVDKEVYVKNSYLFSRNVFDGKFNLYGLFGSGLDSNELCDIYFELLIDHNRLLDRIPMLVTKSLEYGEREVVTQMGIPNVSVNAKNYYVMQRIFSNIYLNNKQLLGGSSFFTIGDGKKVTDNDVIEYAKFLTEKNNYLVWFNTLISYLNGGKVQFDDKVSVADYVDNYIGLYDKLGNPWERKKLVNDLDEMSYVRKLRR